MRIFFQRQQLCLFVDAACVAGQAAVGADDPVAGDDDGDLVVPDRPTHGLCRHPGKTVHRRQLLCQCAVGRGLAVGDLEQQRPDFLPEGGTNGVERRSEVRLLPAEVTIQPALCFAEDGRFLRRMFRVQRIGEIFFAIEPESGQADLIRCQQDAAQRGIVVQRVHHGGSPFISPRARLAAGSFRCPTACARLRIAQGGWRSGGWSAASSRRLRQK